MRLAPGASNDFAALNISNVSQLLRLIRVDVLRGITGSGMLHIKFHSYVAGEKKYRDITGGWLNN